VLWKIGLATYVQKWRVGITLTTPSVGIGGRGDVTYDDTLVGQAVDAQGNPLTFIAIDNQKVGSSFKSPLSIGFGAARRFGKTRVHLAAEWFNRTDLFTILDTEPFQGQSSGETISTDLVRELDHVFNVAVGVEHDVSERLHGYAGFRTDFSGLERTSLGNDGITLLNIYHVSGGATVKIKNNEFTLGGVFSFGDAPVARELVIPGELEYTREANVRYIRVLAILGFSFDF
jgi:long-subunit fatty acid transport protein